MEKYLFSIFTPTGLNIDNMIVTVKVKKGHVTDLGNLLCKLHKDFEKIFEANNTSRSSLIRIDDLREWVVDSKELK